MDDGTSYIHGQNFIRVVNLKVLSRKVYIIEAIRDGMLTSSPVRGTSEISIVNERSHIANAHLKIKR